MAAQCPYPDKKQCDYPVCVDPDCVGYDRNCVDKCASLGCGTCQENQNTAKQIITEVATQLNNTMKASNPKDAVGSDKIPFHLWPETATVYGALGLLDGMLKYGRANWREVGVRASIYYDALRRHLNKWFEGEYTDPDSGLPHFCHMLACIAILIDADAAGKLIDDRQYHANDGYLQVMKEMTPHVKRLKELHANKDPKHYTIADIPQQANKG